MTDKIVTSDNSVDRMANLSPVKQALFELRETRARLAALEQAQTEPVAVIGLSCRFPGGADNASAFWQLLRNGVDAITEIPADRWEIDRYYDRDPLASGKMSTRWGGFLSGIDQFAPDFFGISPREAISMDPQQRLLLEVGWEALEDAGQAPDRLEGSRTGVFVGISSFDYAQFLLNRNQAEIDAYLAQGISHSAAAGRLAYFFGLQGPTLSVDTACSSSLVAVHLGVQSLRQEECQMALVGGVNVILLPELLISFSKSQLMAADGRSAKPSMPGPMALFGLKGVACSS
jgi:acyl transferase domain-containing protein